MFVSIYIYIYIYMYAYIYIYVCIYIYIYVYMLFFSPKCIYLCIYVYVYVCVYIYIFVCICIYIYNVYINLYVCIFLYVEKRKQIHSTCIYNYNYRQHVGILREYVCYVGCLKGSMYPVNARLVVRMLQRPSKQKCWQQLANTREGGATWGPIPWGGGNTGHGTIHTHSIFFFGTALWDSAEPRENGLRLTTVGCHSLDR